MVAGPEAPPEREAALRPPAPRLIAVAAGDRRPRPRRGARALAQRGITRVLAEGGAEVASSLVAADLRRRGRPLPRPVVVGPDGVRALGGTALSAIERSPRYRQVEAGKVGDDIMRRYVRARLMFTGIVTDIGSVIERRGGATTSAASPSRRATTRRRSRIGASITCAGVCLTVIEVAIRASAARVFDVEAAPETLRRHQRARLAGRHAHQSRAGAAGRRRTRRPHRRRPRRRRRGDRRARGFGETTRFRFRVPHELARFIAPKGSVASTARR